MSFSVMDYEERRDEQSNNQREGSQHEMFRGICHGDEHHQSRVFHAQSGARKKKVSYQRHAKGKGKSVRETFDWRYFLVAAGGRKIALRKLVTHTLWPHLRKTSNISACRRPNTSTGA
jgi:hypothetical protein